MDETVFSDFVKALEESMKHTKIEGEIDFPIEVSSVKSHEVRNGGKEVGSWVSIRPCDIDETYLGIHLGDFPLGFFHSYNIETKVLSIFPHSNPAIYVPDLKRVIWGAESWWGFINNPGDLKKISNTDIQNIWYVRALKELLKEEPKNA